MLAEEGYLCSDFGKNVVNDIKSCEQAIDIMQKVVEVKMQKSMSAFDTMLTIESQNEPYGCIIKEKYLIFNSVGFAGGSPNGESRQVCGGNINHHSYPNGTFVEILSLGDFLACNYHLHFCISTLKGPRCNGYPETDWYCCSKDNPCNIGEGDCDTDDDCMSHLICGNTGDGSNNCKIQFPYSGSSWIKTADCCIEPGLNSRV